MPRSVVAKNPWGRWINHRSPTAPKGQNEIAQGKAKRRPGYISALISAPLGSALSGLGMIRAHRTQGKAKRRPGYIGALISAPLGSALSGLGMIRAHRTQGVALGYHLAPRWGKRSLDRGR